MPTHLEYASEIGSRAGFTKKLASDVLSHHSDAAAKVGTVFLSSHSRETTL